MSELATVGIDLAKSVFQIHGVDENGRVLVRRQLRRSQLLAFFQKRPPCLIGMEACAGSHDWGRRLQEMGHDVRLMPPSYVKPYVKRGKTDAADAAAICEAVTRPSMRFVAIKSEACSSVLVLHRTRDFLVRQRTQIGNAIRAHMTEFGIIAAGCAECRSIEGTPGRASGSGADACGFALRSVGRDEHADRAADRRDSGRLPAKRD